MKNSIEELQKEYDELWEMVKGFTTAIIHDKRSIYRRMKEIKRIMKKNENT